MDCALQSGHARICLTLDLAIDTKHNKKQQCQCYVTSSQMAMLKRILWDESERRRSSVAPANSLQLELRQLLWPSV